MKWLTYIYLHSGYRRVMLKSYKYNMDISPASLLVRIKIEDAYWNDCDEWVALKHFFLKMQFLYEQKYNCTNEINKSIPNN